MEVIGAPLNVDVYLMQRRLERGKMLRGIPMALYQRWAPTEAILRGFGPDLYKMGLGGAAAGRKNSVGVQVQHRAFTSVSPSQHLHRE